MLELRRDAFMKLTPRLVLLLTLPPLLWAGNAVTGRLMVGIVSPLLLNALRWALTALLLLPLGWRLLADAPGRRALRRRWRELAWLSLLGMGCFNALQYQALTSSTPVNVTLIGASMPLWMMAVGALFYRVRPHGRQWLGCALSLSGVGVVLTHGEAARLMRVSFVAGDLWMLLAILCWAFYSWLIARPPQARDGSSPVALPWAGWLLVQTALGSLWAGGFAAAEAGFGHAQLAPRASVAAALLFIAVGPSIVAYRCWGLAVSTAGPAVAAFFNNLTPLFAALLSAALLREAPQAYHAVAFALIAAGIAVSSRRP
jgi:drug/metabolite transporter (DMT)-like permease